MNDSSRWLLIIALIALVVSLTNHGGAWLFFGIGSKSIMTLLLIAFAVWFMREKGYCGWDCGVDVEDDDEPVTGEEEA